MSVIEVRYQFRCVHVVPGLPQIVFDSEVFLLYEVAEFPVDHFAVQDLFHHPFLFSVDDLWEWLISKPGTFYGYLLQSAAVLHRYCSDP